MNIGEKIRNTREDMDISQSDMARRIPMNQSNYSKIERGIQEPNLAQLRQICQILHLDPRYLLELDGYETISLDDMRLLSEVKDLLRRYGKEE